MLKSTSKKLDQIEIIGAQAIIGGFRTVALPIAEAEAGLQPTTLRHYFQQKSTWINWHTKPEQHRFWKVKKSICLDNTRWILSLQRVANKLKEITPMLANIENIWPYTRSAMAQYIKVVISETKYTAIKETMSCKEAAAYVDGLMRNGFWWE